MAEENKNIVDVNIESDNDEFVTAVQHGVEDEGLNLPSIFKWSGIGVAIVAAFIVILMFYAQFAIENAANSAGTTSTASLAKELKQEAETILSTYGVVDAEAGIYRIPIDEAINKIAVD